MRLACIFKIELLNTWNVHPQNSPHVYLCNLLITTVWLSRNLLNKRFLPWDSILPFPAASWCQWYDWNTKKLKQINSCRAVTLRPWAWVVHELLATRANSINDLWYNQNFTIIEMCKVLINSHHKFSVFTGCSHCLLYMSWYIVSNSGIQIA